MARLAHLMLLVSVLVWSPAWTGSPERTSYWRERVSLFKAITHHADVVMIGDSLTDGGEWRERFPEQNIANRGIDTTDGVLARLDDIVAARPQLAFVMIGINDFADAHRTVAAVWANYQQIVLSTVTCNEAKGAWKSCASFNSQIRRLNIRLATLASPSVTVIDLWPAFVTRGNLRSDFTLDGVHLNGDGYRQWKNAIAPFMPISAPPVR